jgi:predicted transcriptional regulator
MGKVSYAKIFEQSMEKDNSVKKGVAALRKNGATVLDMIAAVRKVLKISGKELKETLYPCFTRRDFNYTQKKYSDEVKKILSETKKK